MFGPTVIVAVDELAVNAEDVPKNVSADIGLRNSWC